MCIDPFSALTIRIKILSSFVSGALMFIIFTQIERCAPHRNFYKNRATYQCNIWHISRVDGYFQFGILGTMFG